MDILLAGEDQSQADQPNSLAEGPPVATVMETSPFLSFPAKLIWIHQVSPAKSSAVVLQQSPVSVWDAPTWRFEA
eukprot:scaffold52081_cov17-Tisochrysis_lutea.AAC.1